MSKYRNFDLQLEMIDGRQAITGVQMAQHPWLAEYVRERPGCFAPAINRDCVFYFPRGDAQRHD